MFHFDKKIFQKKKRNTSVRTENRTELFRKILSQELIDLNELEQLCFEGIPENNTIKATCWKILLGYLPLNTTEWKSHLQQQRNLYEFYINLLFQNPETYNNGQPYNTNDKKNNKNNNKNNITSITPNTDSLVRSYSARPASQSNFSDYVAHQTLIQPKYGTYFQDEKKQHNSKKKIGKPDLFDSDNDENHQTKPGLFDSDNDNDNDNDDDVLGITEKNKNHKNNKNNDDNDDNDEAETPIPKEVKEVNNDHESQAFPMLNKTTQNTTQLSMNNKSESDEIVFITPSISLKSSTSNTNNLLNDPLLKDLTSLSEAKEHNCNEHVHEEHKTATKHAKTDSKILINGKDINEINNNNNNNNNNKSKALSFKPTNHPDPLSQTPNNPWTTYFDDWEIWNRIKKDIHRTHQTYAFFRSNHMICPNSMSKQYRFPFDISTEPPPPITPSMSSTIPNLPNFPTSTAHSNSNNPVHVFTLNQKDGNPKHRKLDSAPPILNIPLIPNSKTKIIKHKGSSSESYEDSISSSLENEDIYDNDNNSDANTPKHTPEAEKVEEKTTKRVSLLKIDADDEIISDIESVDDDEFGVDGKPHMISILNGNDLPPPAAKNIKFVKSDGYKSHNTISISREVDPNKKARIERYVMDSKQHGIHAQVMIRILCVYARLNKGVEYVQGMNELLAPIYYIFNMDPSENNRYAEADSFFCFMNLMSYLADRFIAESDNSQLGIIAIVNEFDELLERVDFELWSVLNKQDLDSKFYALRWLMLLMAMEFQLPEVLRLWDSFLSDHDRFEFVTYFAIAMLHKVKPQLMAGNFAENLQLLQKYPSFDLYELLLPAMQFRDKYPLAKHNYNHKKKKKKKNKNKNNTERNSLKNKHKKGNKNKQRKSRNSRSPRGIFQDGQSSAKDLFGNILRPQSTRTTNNRNNNNRPNPAHNIFRSRTPNSASDKNTSTALQRHQSFLGSWKKKWGAK